ncbi:hypothetical protein HDU88_007947 [Geranomyces variabilis]|nr:hypothetical protein HDU88_007947 [Geranomyces variabilis]
MNLRQYGHPSSRPSDLPLHRAELLRINSKPNIAPGTQNSFAVNETSFFTTVHRASNIGWEADTVKRLVANDKASSPQPIEGSKPATSTFDHRLLHQSATISAASIVHSTSSSEPLDTESNEHQSATISAASLGHSTSSSEHLNTESIDGVRGQSLPRASIGLENAPRPQPCQVASPSTLPVTAPEQIVAGSVAVGHFPPPELEDASCDSKKAIFEPWEISPCGLSRTARH